jgi:Cd2+/Zn2+-exporting ATPase
MVVTHQPLPTLLAAMQASLKGLGYELKAAETHPSEPAPNHDGEAGCIRISTRRGRAVVALRQGSAHLGLRRGSAGRLWDSQAGAGYGELGVPRRPRGRLVPIARRALLAARLGSPFSIEMLMTIAAVGAS